MSDDAPPPARAAGTDDDATAALSADLAREIAETSDLQGQIGVRTKIRASASNPGWRTSDCWTTPPIRPSQGAASVRIHFSTAAGRSSSS